MNGRTGKRLRLTLCFEAGSVSGVEIAALVKSGAIGFAPSLVRLPHIDNEEIEWKKDSIQDLVRAPRDFQAGLAETADRLTRRFQVATIPTQKMQAVYWYCELGEIPDAATLEQLIAHTGFHAGYIAEQSWESSQSIRDLATFKLLGGDPSTVRTVADSWTGRTVIDWIHRPGRKVLLGAGMWLQAAWKCWFGERAQHLLGMDRILSIPQALSVRETVNDVIEVELFQNPLESDSARNVAIQQAFHDHFDLELVSWVSRCVYPVPDRRFAREIDVISSGPSFSVRVGRDGEGRIVKESVATRVWDVSCDRFGKIESLRAVERL